MKQQEGNVHVIDVKSGSEIKKFVHYAGARITSLAIPRGSDAFLATGDSKGLIKLWAPAEDDKVNFLLLTSLTMLTLFH